MGLDEGRFKTTVLTALNMTEGEYSEELQMGECAKWDSLSHIGLIFAVEDAFGVRFETEEIPQMKSLPILRAAIEQRGH